MKRLNILFGSILILMIAVTAWALMQESVVEGYHHMRPWRWATATLADAYCGFITFFAWVCYKERSLIARVVWLIAILALGNIAMAAYVLWQIRKMKPGQGPEALLLRGSTK